MAKMLLDLNKEPGSGSDGYDAEGGPDHIPTPEDSSGDSEDSMSSSATAFLGELLGRLQQSDAVNPGPEFNTLQADQLRLPLPDGQRKEMLMNAQVATHLKRNAAGCFKGAGDHHAHNNGTTSGSMMHSSPSKGEYNFNLIAGLPRA